VKKLAAVISEWWFKLTACPMCKARRDSLFFGTGVTHIDFEKFFKQPSQSKGE
jgi:hypothetical protein